MIAWTNKKIYNKYVNKYTRNKCMNKYKDTA